MIQRRAMLMAVGAGLLMSSCVVRGDPRPWHGTFAKFRAVLPSLATGHDVAEKFGEPDRRDTFNPESPKNFPSLRTREGWQNAFVAEPAGLIATLPLGTTLMAYGFSTKDALNATTGVAYICVDDSDRVIGWIYGSYLNAYPKDIWLMG